jgi:hypothetical protein
VRERKRDRRGRKREREVPMLAIDSEIHLSETIFLIWSRLGTNPYE